MPNQPYCGPAQQQNDRVKIVGNIIVIINKGSEWQSIPDHAIFYTKMVSQKDIFISFIKIEREPSPPSSLFYSMTRAHGPNGDHIVQFQNFINVTLYEIIESHSQPPPLYQAILYTIMVLYIDGSNSSAKIKLVINLYCTYSGIVTESTQTLSC